MDVSGHPGANDGLTRAWLISSLQISADEQAAFLRRMLGRELGLSGHAYAMTAETMPEFQAPAAGRCTARPAAAGRSGRTASPTKAARSAGSSAGPRKAAGGSCSRAGRCFDRPAEGLNGRKVRDGLLADLAALAG